VVPRRASLDEALSHLETPWATSPFAEASRELLLVGRKSISKQLKDYDLRAEELAAEDDASWVVTHGEPHGANFVTTASGEMHLIDWDTVCLAPRERDTWLIVGDSPDALRAYQLAAGPYTPDRDLMDFFALRWLVADLAVYVRRLYQPHTGSDDDKRALDALTNYIVPALTAR
jgi:spectinomycin phosphotransferase